MAGFVWAQMCGSLGGGTFLLSLESTGQLAPHLGAGRREKELGHGFPFRAPRPTSQAGSFGVMQLVTTVKACSG